MQEIKFRIKNTESANVEIVPVADGVEIIVKYGDAAPSPSYETKTTYTDKAKFKFHKKDEENLEILKEFCGKLKKDETVDRGELLRFFSFYAEKVNNGWKGTIKPGILWTHWLETAK